MDVDADSLRRRSIIDYYRVKYQPVAPEDFRRG